MNQLETRSRVKVDLGMEPDLTFVPPIVEAPLPQYYRTSGQLQTWTEKLKVTY